VALLRETINDYRTNTAPIVFNHSKVTKDLQDDGRWSYTQVYIYIYTYRSTVVVTTYCDLGTFLILIVIQIELELLAELVGKRCWAFLVAQQAKEIECPLDTSTSGGLKAISAAILGQTSMNLSDSDGLVKNRDKITPKHEADAFTRILAGKLVPAAHLLGRLNAPT